jgi:8-oxo-dGTP pyrophosphatase MutT (NUDIX family)
MKRTLKEALEGRTFWGIRGSGILLQRKSDGKVCLFLRDGTMQSGTWGILGGKVDEGEDALESAIREAEEESGKLPAGGFSQKHYIFKMPLTPGDFLRGDGEKHLNRYAEAGEVFTYTTFLYTVEDDNWAPRLNWEHSEFKWFDPDDLPSNTLALIDLDGQKVYPVTFAIRSLVS